VVVGRIRGKFQRAFPEGMVPSPVSCLMLSSSGFLKGEMHPQKGDRRGKVWC